MHLKILFHIWCEALSLTDLLGRASLRFGWFSEDVIFDKFRGHFLKSEKLLMFARTLKYFCSVFWVLIIFWIEFSSRISSILGCNKQTLMFDNFGNSVLSNYFTFWSRCIWKFCFTHAPKHSPWQICWGELRWAWDDFSEDVIFDKFRGHFLKSEKTFDVCENIEAFL